MDFDYAHLTPYEPAARIYCGMVDQDPDEQMELPHPMGLAGVKFTRPAPVDQSGHAFNIERSIEQNKNKFASTG